MPNFLFFFFTTMVFSIFLISLCRVWTSFSTWRTCPDLLEFNIFYCMSVIYICLYLFFSITEWANIWGVSSESMVLSISVGVASGLTSEKKKMNHYNHLQQVYFTYKNLPFNTLSLFLFICTFNVSIALNCLHKASFQCIKLIRI
jgi:hypothetical protein